MWAKLVVLVTLLPMLVHCILGCCWHHAHSECNFSNVSSPVESLDCGGHRHNHLNVQAHSSDSTEPVVPLPCRHDKPCDDFQCVYIVAEYVRIADVFELYEHVAALNVSRIMFRSVTAATQRNLHQPQNVSAALHHCALTQVLVI